MRAWHRELTRPRPCLPRLIGWGEINKGVTLEPSKA